MDDSSKLESIEPIKSDQELTADASNRENPDAPREDPNRERRTFTPIMAPNLSPTPNVGGPLAGGLNATRGAQAPESEADPRDIDENADLTGNARMDDRPD